MVIHCLNLFTLLKKPVYAASFIVSDLIARLSLPGSTI
jgi:hypothetical protein